MEEGDDDEEQDQDDEDDDEDQDESNEDMAVSDDDIKRQHLSQGHLYILAGNGFEWADIKRVMNLYSSYDNVNSDLWTSITRKSRAAITAFGLRKLPDIPQHHLSSTDRKRINAFHDVCINLSARSQLFDGSANLLASIDDRHIALRIQIDLTGLGHGYSDKEDN